MKEENEIKRRRIERIWDDFMLPVSIIFVVMILGYYFINKLV